MLLLALHQMKVSMILMLHVKFLLQYSKKQGGLCQLDLTSDILINRKKVLYNISIEGETKDRGEPRAS